MPCDHHALACSSCGLTYAARVPGKGAPAPVEFDEISVEPRVVHVAFGGVRASLPKINGLEDIATLIARRGKHVPAATLYARTIVRLRPPHRRDSDSGEHGHIPRDEEFILEGVHEDVVMDAQAISEARSTAARLRLAGKPDEADEVEGYVRAAMGLHGPRRHHGGLDQRSRVAVQKRIKQALAKLRQAHPGLWEHLGGHAIHSRQKRFVAALRTGALCVYDPPNPAPHWLVSGVA